MRALVVVGRHAKADASVRLDDLPGTSGRLDVVARAVRAALCVSHGVRRDVRFYAVLLGGEVPWTVRIDGAEAKFVRPDERSLAILLLKSIARASADAAGFVAQRHGVAVARGGLATALDDVAGEPLYLLDETGSDARAALPSTAMTTATSTEAGAVFVLGDPTGLDDEARALLAQRGARPIAVGPVSLQTDDVIAVVHNELDRRAAR